MDEIFLKKLKNVEEWLAAEYSGIRTGQATPALLDSIKVQSYGSLMPLNQIGSIGVEDARTLRLSCWDSSVIPAVEKAITEADLGVSVATDSAGLRIIFPELTSERRVQLLKLAKNKLEDGRVRVRGARDDAMKSLDAEEKAGGMGKDEKFAKKDQIQKKVDETNAKLEQFFDAKELEINK
jgi:ribosome recycling factor